MVHNSISPELQESIAGYLADPDVANDEGRELLVEITDELELEFWRVFQANVI